MPMKLSTSKRKTSDDEFYTMYKDCVRELHKYDLRGKKIICPCDTPDSNIYKYLKDCYYDVTCDSKEWRNVDYSKYDLVITNPPFSQVREFISYLVHQQIDFIIIVSDVLRYSIANGRIDFGVFLYKGWDAQNFLRPDGSIKSIHCGWVSTIKDDYGENRIIGDDSMITKEFGKGKCLNGGVANDDIYTPRNISKEIINMFDLKGLVLDPFKGDGSFYDQFPSSVEKDWCEIKEGKDFFNYNKSVDWIVSNPPYSILDDVLKHSFEIADNIVYLVPLSKVVSSMDRIRKINSFGGVPYIYILSAAKCEFPFGFPACVIHFKYGYRGPTTIEVDVEY